MRADAQPPLLLPDAGPIVTLAYAQALDLLLKPGWPVHIVDMLLHEVTRNRTPTSAAIAAWVDANTTVLTTRTMAHYRKQQSGTGPTPRKANHGELAVQEAMNDLALREPSRTGVFLFEDHKIASTSFLLPESCRRVSTRAFLIFLEQKGWLVSAAEVERKAIVRGRVFAQLRFPPA